MNSGKQLEDLGIQDVVDGLDDINGLRGILCFGSYASGCFDADSDVDLYVIWHPEIPPPEERLSGLQQVRGIEDIDIGHTEPGWPAEEWCPQCDRFRLRGVLFDVGHNTMEWVTAAVRKARTFPREPDGRKYLNILSLLDNSVILSDRDECVAKLASQIYPFPSDLKVALISENMTIMQSSLADLQDYTRRGIGNNAFRFHLMRITHAIGGVLFAVNEKYDPVTKRVEEAFKRLPLVPVSFLDRFLEITSTALDECGRQKTTRDVALLVRDLERLIEEHAEPAHPAAFAADAQTVQQRVCKSRR